MSKITVVPGDNLVIVDGFGLKFDFSAPANVHAIQWDGDHGHIEYMDSTTTPNRELKSGEYASVVGPYVAAWNTEKERVEAEEARKKREEEEKYNSTEQRFVRLRAERDKRLAETDYLLISDYPISAEKLDVVRQYRKALRDLPGQPGAPWTDSTIPWPVKPQV